MASSAENWSETGPAEDAVQPPLRIKPPLIALMLIVVGWGVHLFVPVSLVPGPWLQFVIAAPLVVAGIAVIAVSAKTFARVDTDDRFETPTRAIVTQGPYARSRNPMYIGATVAFIGIAIAVDTVWILALAPVLVGYFWMGVIRREERYLERRFGDTYAAYRSRVRRWV
jgi:protein-S-isoprenylcysteine O-methyltransferase Ste14